MRLITGDPQYVDSTVLSLFFVINTAAYHFFRTVKQLTLYTLSVVSFL